MITQQRPLRQQYAYSHNRNGWATITHSL